MQTKTELNIKSNKLREQAYLPLLSRVERCRYYPYVFYTTESLRISYLYVELQLLYHSLLRV